MRQVSIKDLENNPQSFMVSSTWCGPCIQIKKAHKASNLPYVNYDEIFTDGVFHKLDVKERNLELDHFLNTIGIKVSHFPTFVEYKDGKYSIFPRLDKKEILYPELIEEADIIE